MAYATYSGLQKEIVQRIHRHTERAWGVLPNTIYVGRNEYDLMRKSEGDEFNQINKTYRGIPVILVYEHSHLNVV